MAITKSRVSLSIDDYLDLLNYAKQIGDTSWQEEILNKLNTFHSNASEAEERLLWHQFDEINNKMIELITKIDQAQGFNEQQFLMDELLSLKIQRITIHHQIRSLKDLN